jgi:hypothetical protein
MFGVLERSREEVIVAYFKTLSGQSPVGTEENNGNPGNISSPRLGFELGYFQNFDGILVRKTVTWKIKKM